MRIKEIGCKNIQNPGRVCGRDSYRMFSCRINPAGCHSPQLGRLSRRLITRADELFACAMIAEVDWDRICSDAK